MTEIKTLSTLKTEFSADSVEWCPIENFQNIFVCGTYQLQEDNEENKAQERLGKIYLFSVNDKSVNLIPDQIIDTSGILDQKWCQHIIDNCPVLGVVTSKGYLEIYKLIINMETNKPSLIKLVQSLVTESEDILALSIDWSFKKDSIDPTKIAISDSKGNISIHELNDNINVVKLCSIECHGFEAWITAFDYWDSNIVYSGGDDSLFKVHDLRNNNFNKITNRSHNAGVTSVHSHYKKENILVTGSYDETVRLWDNRNFRRPIDEENVKGGVWRLKWNPLSSEHILAACMYGGFRILKCQDLKTIKIETEYNEHESIAYGADWSHQQNSNNTQMISTCSFYDCQLNLSKVKLQ